MPLLSTTMIEDIAANVIQRARDYGMVSYNELREAYGLPKMTSFEQISQDRTLSRFLKNAYGMYLQMH